MSFRGMLIKAGIDSNGTDIAIFNGYLKLQTDNVMYFRNTNTYIYSNADGYLTIYASNGIIMNGDIAVDGDVDFDGGFSCTGDVVDGLIISGTESDNGIEITGVAQGSGIDIDYTIPLTTSYALNIDVDTSIAAGTTWATNQHYTTLAGGASVGTSWFELTMGGNHGSYAICTFARLDYTDAGYTAVGGMGVAGMFEILLPNAAAGGEYHILALEFAEVGTSYESASALGSPTSFIKFETYGAGATEIDDLGYLFYVNGPTPNTDKLLSLTSQTLRLDINELARYMVLSQAQDILSLGISGTEVELANAGKPNLIAGYGKVGTETASVVLSTAHFVMNSDDDIARGSTYNALYALNYYEGASKTLGGASVHNAGWFEVWSAGTTDWDIGDGTYVSAITASLDFPAVGNLHASGFAYGVRITNNVNAGFDASGTFDALRIDKQGGRLDWKLGIDVNNCGTGIEIGATTTVGLTITGLQAGNAVLIGTGATGLSYDTDGDFSVGIFSDFTAQANAYFRGLYVESTYVPAGDTANSASVYAIRGRTVHTKTYDPAAAETLTGVHGHFMNSGTIDGAGAVINGVRGEIGGSGTWTEVKFAAAVQATLSLGVDVSAGVYANFLAYANNETYPANCALYLWGYYDVGIDMRGVVTGMQSAFAFKDSFQAGIRTKALAGNQDKMLQVLVGTTEYYIALYDSFT